LADFRSERMPTPDGHGNARNRWQRGWDAYARTVNRVALPALQPVLKVYAQNTTVDLMGFWLVWQLEGGFEGVQKSLGMSRSAVYRRLAAFRRTTGMHPDDFSLPGVKFDIEEYVRAAAQRASEVNDGRTQAEL
jgi:hypothetical protein